MTTGSKKPNVSFALESLFLQSYIRKNSRTKMALPFVCHCGHHQSQVIKAMLSKSFFMSESIPLLRAMSFGESLS